MLTEIYIEALLVDEELADQKWEAMEKIDKADISSVYRILQGTTVIHLAAQANRRAALLRGE